MPSSGQLELLAIPPPDAVIDRRQAFVRACGRKQGLRIASVAAGLRVLITLGRVETLGPVVEAAAIITGSTLLLRHPDGDLSVPIGADLEVRPSGIWAAIGDAVDEDDVAASRGGVARDPFRHVSIQRIDGNAAAMDARPPRTEPLDNALPSGEGEITKYDDLDWHLTGDGSRADVDRAFVHIAVYIGWLVRHDLHDPGALRKATIRSFQRGLGIPSGLISEVDQKLMSNVMSGEGWSFSDVRYAAYLEAFDNAFPDASQIPDANTVKTRMEPILDEMYRRWVDAGRPDVVPGRRQEDPSEQLGAVFKTVGVDWIAIRQSERTRRGEQR